MHVLAFDTCLGAVSVAVRYRTPAGEWRLHDAFETRERGHAERLMPMIADTMAAAGVTFADLGRIAVTSGPGSFTGVRAGIAAARGLALASGVPIVAATSLAVLARQATETLGAALAGRQIAVALDGRRGMVFLELFDAQDPTAPSLLPATLVEPGDAAALIGSRPVIVVGSAGGVVAAAINQAGGRAEALLPDIQVHAHTLALMAERLPPVQPLRPLYLRAPDAKPQADKALPRSPSSAQPRAVP